MFELGSQKGRESRQLPEDYFAVVGTKTNNAVRAHIPHTSSDLSGEHRSIRTILFLPTVYRISRGLSRRAPPDIRSS